MSLDYARASVLIDAPAQKLFDIVAQPANHPKIDGSSTVTSPLPGSPDYLYLGARFGMDMNMKMDYQIRSVVTEFLPGQIIAWKPLSRHTWRYTFTPYEGKTLVTEEWDARGVWNRFIMRPLNVQALNQKSIEATLQRLKSMVEQ